MKTNNKHKVFALTKKKGAAALIIAAIIATALLFTGCPNAAKASESLTSKPTVTFSVDGSGGTLKAKVEGGSEINSGDKVAHGTTITFTATVASNDYVVEKWTIAGGVLQSGGTDGSPTATVQITSETAVKVNFSCYKSVAFGTNGADLADYLNTGSAAADGIYYIKITGLTAADLKGDSNAPAKPSLLGKILQDNPSKKFALKFGELPAVTDINSCFKDCENLIKPPVLPATVTNMENCFYNCKRLTQAPLIPASVTNMKKCFAYCENLTHVPALPAGVTNMSGCFTYCENLTQAPALPTGVKDMTSCFEDCKNLIQAPELPAGVKDMTSCFKGCEKLTQAPSAIPQDVTNLDSCFNGCEKLTQAPVIPASVTNMRYCFQHCRSLTSVTLKCNYGGKSAFLNAFGLCDKLTAGTIKVPSTQLDAYRAGANDMGTQQNRFVGE